MFLQRWLWELRGGKRRFCGGGAFNQVLVGVRRYVCQAGLWGKRWSTWGFWGRGWTPCPARALFTFVCWHAFSGEPSRGEWVSERAFCCCYTCHRERDKSSFPWYYWSLLVVLVSAKPFSKGIQGAGQRKARALFVQSALTRCACVRDMDMERWIWYVFVSVFLLDLIDSSIIFKRKIAGACVSVHDFLMQIFSFVNDSSQKKAWSSSIGAVEGLWGNSRSVWLEKENGDSRMPSSEFLLTFP